MMKYGMPTLIENKSLGDNVKLCKELGLSFIELNMNFPDYQLESLEKVKELRSIMEQNEIFFTIHLDENLSVTDFNRGVRNAYLDTVKRAIHVAQQLDAPILNTHMNHGIYVTLPDKKVQLYEQYLEVYLDAFDYFADLCEKEIGTGPLRVCIENTNGFRNYEKTAIDRCLKKPQFGLTWDIGHSFCSQQIDLPFIEERMQHLCHMHIHDSLDNHNHLALGSGRDALQERLAVAKKQNCRCVLETKTIAALKKSVQWMQDNGYLFPSII